MNKSNNRPTIALLIRNIAELKCEHQRTVFKLNKQNEQLRKNISNLRKKSEEDDGTMQGLRDENRSLLLHIKQLESQATQETNDKKDQSDDDSEKKIEYEVEEILKDKMIRKRKHYLVRWKGFDEKDNTWVLKKDLCCPELLEKYERSKFNK